MDKRMLKARMIVQAIDKLTNELKDESIFTDQLKDLFGNLRERYKTEYNHFKQVEKAPTTVFQMFGKKVSDLTIDEFKEYKAFLKRARTRKKLQEKLDSLKN